MKFYGTREAADLLGVKVRTLREWIKLGKIKVEKSEDEWRWKISEEEICRLRSKTSQAN